jgi:hypothetical protein
MMQLPLLDRNVEQHWDHGVYIVQHWELGSHSKNDLWALFEDVQQLFGIIFVQEWPKVQQ